MILYSVFFFQAEDGIRDDLVTGVQTCALPIYWRETQIAKIKIANLPDKLKSVKLFTS